MITIFENYSHDQMPTEFFDKNTKQIRMGDRLKYKDHIYKVKYGNFTYDGIKRIGVHIQRDDNELVQVPQITMSKLVSLNSEVI